jgi:acetylornithine deacetylase
MNENSQIFTAQAADLLKKMIPIPSYSFEEEKRADFLYSYLTNRAFKTSPDILVERIKNNMIVYNRNFCCDKELLMICSHIDTVKESGSYSLNPFEPFEKEGVLYGLGSNDDGASVVCQIETFFQLNTPENANKLPVNLMLVLTAEEERSGINGMDLVMETLAHKSICETNVSLLPHFAIVGEPTGMQAAIAERGLLVLDGKAEGISGHAARNEGVNALYIALDDIQTLRNYRFPKHSPLMGEVKLTITQMNCGTAHNVVPDTATFVADIRPTEQYNNAEILELLQKETQSTLTARNLTNRTSATPQGHRLMQTIGKLGIKNYVSPTTSDWMRLTIPAVKMGPGESSRSHKADEFIKISELEQGITGYIQFITNL